MQLRGNKSTFNRSVITLAIGLSVATGCTTANADNKLAARALLPAATFAQGPTSGEHIAPGPINGQELPFSNKQPVQGFSAVLNNHDGSFLLMSDNGFGSMENSADFNLRVYTVRPDFKTGRSGSGKIAVQGFFELSDPDHRIPYAITNDFTRDRILTGADLDIESMQRAPDGTLWFGDEFGPFLVHTDAHGRVLEAPIPLPDFANGGQLRSPQNPYNEEASAVRIMNAVRAHARAHGDRHAPVFSPYHVMLKDNNPVVGHYARDNTPQPGLAPAASDIFDIQSMQQAGYPIVAWTVNDKPRMLELMGQGINGIISDRPDLLLQAVREFDANGDGLPGDYLDADGLVDGKKFDAQAHRGGRDLRPENTLPSMEAGLDNLMATLETDSGISRDGIPTISHDPYIEAGKCRRADGAPYTPDHQVLIKDFSIGEIQSTFICDKTFRGPSQRNDRALSPVAVAYAASRGLMDPYVMPTVRQLFDFVDFYAGYYRSGAGSSHADATRRWHNAARVRFNIETKINPRSDRDAHGVVYKDRTVDFITMADKLAGLIASHGMAERADVQSFDFRTLLYVQEKFPQIRSVYLFGDFPIYNSPDTDDGTNMQDENGANTPWMAGLRWPYRSTALTHPFRARASGGFEGMALTADGHALLPLLEKPLVGTLTNTLLIHEFDLAGKRYTGRQYEYPLDQRGTSIGDFVMVDARHGLVIERDGSQGDLNGFKTIYDVTLRGDAQPVAKEVAVDLLNINDPHRISEPGQPGDIGIGRRFAFPFVTIEDVVVLDRKHIGVLNDNNYPFSIGRHVGSGQPDDNEFIVIELDEPLKVNAETETGDRDHAERAKRHRE
jgi:glycerophosphoryl diester phosphodiesterase